MVGPGFRIVLDDGGSWASVQACGMEPYVVPIERPLCQDRGGEAKPYQVRQLLTALLEMGLVDD
jgi:hypothetical protein